MLICWTIYVVLYTSSLEGRGADRNPWLAKMGIQYVIVICSMNVKETQRGSPETLSTFDTHDTARRQNNHNTSI
jgi:hypothetical protein